MASMLGNAMSLSSPVFYQQAGEPQEIEEDLRPYASLFLKPLTNKKSAFTKRELEIMCHDPLHSPQLILYLINFFKHM
jgi:hypothetical protein